MRLPVLAAPQRFLELSLVQAELAGQRRQYADLADVTTFDEERLKDPMVVFIPLAVLAGESTPS